MKIVLTGASGFLGWHTRARLRALTDHEVRLVTRDNWEDLAAMTYDADALVHVAGVNRGTPHEVDEGNVTLAQDVARAIRASSRIERIVYANSIWAGTGSPYGHGKAAANSVLAEAAAQVGAHYVDVRLPNIFGEGGRPNYNSFVATFVERTVSGEEPEIQDRGIDLLHVQGAAQAIMQALTTTLPFLEPQGTSTSVKGIWDALVEMKRLYDVGDVPKLLTRLDIDLFNTLRWAMFPEHYPINLTQHADNRGTLVETVRSHGGQGQTFVSTTHPGITRGEHFHIEKIERFVVLQGEARISLRKIFSEDTITFDVAGENPAIIDMPTMWVHNITNIGDSELLTLFWAHELFDPENPDTFREAVNPTTARDQGWATT